MKQLFLLVVAAVALADDDLPTSCDRPVYCDSKLLHYVQISGIYEDSKTFVDLHMKQDEKTILIAFDQLLNETDNNPSKDQIKDFVNENFDEIEELEEWSPPDYSENPPLLEKIRDNDLRQFAKEVNEITLTLGRKVKAAVIKNASEYSFIPVTNGFVVPGGRFKELYYWDTYWIIEGLLITGMPETVKGVIENLIELLNLFGHIPNGSRCYYQRRSQPPLLSAMAMLYYQNTKDIEFLRQNIKPLEAELNFWLDNHIVTFSKDDRVFTMLRYYAPSSGPRPESYKEDYTSAETSDFHKDHNEFYIDMKSAAESGFDFSTRWFISPQGDNTGNLTNIHTRYIAPVDLNSIFANALQNVATFNAILGNSRRATHWAFLAKQWRDTIQQVMWNAKDGIWYDYDILNMKQRKHFYTSNFSPLWMSAVEEPLVKINGPKVINYLKNSPALDFPGGIPISFEESGEQWDFPNVWPPEVSIVINALRATQNKEGEELAFRLAQDWVRICRKGYLESQMMFEKYDARVPGKFGGGGEYVVQAGFGWSNGVVFEFLDEYGETMTAYDAEPNEELKVVPLQATKVESEGEKEVVVSAITS